MAHRKTEQRFLTELKNSTIHFFPKSAWYLIQDTVFGNKKSGSKFTLLKPFDRFWAIKGQTIAIEGKAHQKKKSEKILPPWPLSAVKDHQLKALEKHRDTEQGAFVIVNVRNDLGKKRINRAYILRPEEIRAHMSKNQDSLTLADLEKYPTMVWNSKGKVWNVHTILDALR